MDKRKNAGLIDAMCNAVLVYPGALYSENLRFEMTPNTARRIGGRVEAPVSFMGVSIRLVDGINGIRLVDQPAGQEPYLIWIGALEDENE